MNKETINIKRLSFVYTRRQQLSEKYRAKFTYALYEQVHNQLFDFHNYDAFI